MRIRKNLFVNDSLAIGLRQVFLKCLRPMIPPVSDTPPPSHFQRAICSTDPMSVRISRRSVLRAMRIRKFSYPGLSILTYEAASTFSQLPLFVIFNESGEELVGLTEYYNSKNDSLGSDELKIYRLDPGTVEICWTR